MFSIPHQFSLSECVPVVGLGQLEGHGQDGQASILLWPQRLTETTTVEQTPFPGLNEHSAQQLLVVPTVRVKHLKDTSKIFFTIRLLSTKLFLNIDPVHILYCNP